MIRMLLFAALIFLSCRAHASVDEEKKTLGEFVDLIAHDKKAEAAKMIEYPLKRPEPLPPIKNEAEFIDRFSEMFDGKGIKELIAAREAKQFEELGWHGISIASRVWLSENLKVSGISNSAEGDRKQNEAQAKKHHATYSTVAKYDALKFECRTTKFHVQIQAIGQKLRYVAWDITKSTSQKPDLVLSKGEEDSQGTCASSKYTFRSGAVEYKVEDAGNCGEADENRLTVIKGGKSIVNEVCAPLVGAKK